MIPKLGFFGKIFAPGATGDAAYSAGLLTLAIFCTEAIIAQRSPVVPQFVNPEEIMARDLKEDFFRLDGAWASFELMSIRRRDDYLKPFRVLRCKIDDQVDFQAPETLRSATEATVLIEIFGEEELVAANGRGPVQAVDNAMRKILEKHYPQLSEVRLEEFDVRLLHHGVIGDDEEKGVGALVRVMAIFSDGGERWGTVGVAADILQASVECIIDGLEWKLRGEHKH
jgi:2-isopropylmalate synthase